MLVLLSFFACAPSDYFQPVSEIDAAGMAPDNSSLPADGASFDGERTVASITPTILNVELPREMEGFIEVRAYRTDEDGAVSWVGRALLREEIEGRRMSLVLPPDPPARDRTGFAGDIRYALVVRGVTASGAPGIYRGVSEASIVFVPGVIPEGAGTGWNVAFDYDSDAPDWHPTDETIYLDEGLVAPRAFELSGTSVAPLSGAARLVVATSDDPEAIIATDQPIDLDWNLVISGSGSAALAEAMSTSGVGPAVPGLGFRVFAYDDLDGDGVRTGEPLAGEVCLDGGPTTVTWFEPATTLESALLLDKMGRRSGWDIVGFSEHGSFPVASEDRERLTLELGCD